MRKIAVILISFTLIASFGVLVYYAVRHSYGVPGEMEKVETVLLDVPFQDKEIDLEKGIAEDFWDGLAQKEVKLMYQAMVLPWPKQVVPSVSVKIFHNAKEIYFYLTWDDDTEDRILDVNKFSDACALMFPMDEKLQPQTLMMGFIGRANIWQWKASQDREYWQKIKPEKNPYSDFYYPFEEKETLSVSKDEPQSAVNDLSAIRVGTITPKPIQNISGRGYFGNGGWRVVFKRSLKSDAPEIDAQFVPGKILCAFAVWDGSKGDRGGRKSISDWVELSIE